ncbi:glucose-1-phosphate adenylyltransferase [Neobacillus notoginsengisoli]|uniref:Glucose-1-phosphate adenylyltransferase n=1 Tax=Neobacillus notoginsengisoli TaxID=1578198 RepID=A0A417YDP2_9BACI|nr:glucose-1-phosphate adenylyltransferase [Neobacillus notoginsengisoli]RHW30757.1 glucose-1-phosphate adenylyltransferase [Neobacillus notoginsengisoli]
MAKKKCVAMLLAGGQGSRLKLLTKELAKPAVPFGGKYRIIDFTLSNCANSGIDTVGVLTQYQPMVLNSYIGIGSAWDLDRKDGGVTVLPPFSESTEVKWYTGTACAVYQNLHYMKQYDPEYILILSGDHIYKMNYEDMLQYHIEKKAEVTISVVEVPFSDANRFGIMNTDDDMRILEFEEKPNVPKNNLASMGIYIFNWKTLLECLARDYENEKSSHDFGKDVIPGLVNEGRKLYAYPFKGYWKDVGTVRSFWEANLDLLDDTCGLNLFDQEWRIYSVNPNQPPQFISSDAVVIQSLVNEGCTVDGDIERSVLFQGVTVEKGSFIKESVIMPDAVIGKNTVIERAIVPCNLKVPDGMVIKPPDGEIVLVNKEMIQKHVLATEI